MVYLRDPPAKPFFKPCSAFKHLLQASDALARAPPVFDSAGETRRQLSFTESEPAQKKQKQSASEVLEFPQVDVPAPLTPDQQQVS